METTKFNIFIMIALGIILGVNCIPRPSESLVEGQRLAQLKLARERSQYDRVQRIKSHVAAGLRLQGKKVPTETQMHENDSITKRAYRKLADSVNPTDDLDLIRMLDSEKDERSVSYHIKSQSLYPKCILPGEVGRYLKIDEETKNFHHMFFNFSQIDQNPDAKYAFPNATLTLFSNKMNPTSSPNMDQLHVKVFMLLPTESGPETALIDNKYFLRKRGTNVHLNIATAVEVWHKYPQKNFGMYISISDENDKAVLFQDVFQKMDCSKNFTINPFPARLAASMSPSLLEKIYWKMNELGTSTDIQSFTEMGLNMNHLPFLDYVMLTFSKDDQLNNGEQETLPGNTNSNSNGSELEKSTSNANESDSLKNFPEQSRVAYFQKPRPNFPTLKRNPISNENLEKLAKGNIQKLAFLMNMPSDQPSAEAPQDKTLNYDVTLPRSRRNPMIIKRKDLVKLMVDHLENKDWLIF